MISCVHKKKKKYIYVNKYILIIHNNNNNINIVTYITLLKRNNWKCFY